MRVIAAVLTCAICALGASSAAAEKNGGAVTGPTGVTIHATDGSTIPSQPEQTSTPSAGRGPVSSCPTRYQAVDPHDINFISKNDPTPTVRNDAGDAGNYYWSFDCNGAPLGPVFISNRDPRVAGLSPPPDPAVLAAAAVRSISVASPAVHMNPTPGQNQLVGLPTWLWVDADALGTKTASVSAGAVTVSAAASATRVVWDMGDGDTVTCDGAGTAYDPARPDTAPTCSYTYRQSSAGQPDEAYLVTATVTWAASYTVTGAPGGGALPPITRSATVAVRVAEAQTINNG